MTSCWPWCGGPSTFRAVADESPQDKNCKPQPSNKQQPALTAKKPVTHELSALHTQGRSFDKQNRYAGADSILYGDASPPSLSQSLASYLQLNTNPPSIHGSGPSCMSDAVPRPAVESLDGSVIEDEELVFRAALPDHSKTLPVVSSASLKASFCQAPQAVAVVRVAKQQAGVADVSLLGGCGTFRRSDDNLCFSVRASGGGYATSCRNSSFDDCVLPSASTSIRHSKDGGATDVNAINFIASFSNNIIGAESDSEQLARLEPVFLNKPLHRMLEISTMEEYSFIMDKQMMRNPMLVMLFENSVRRLLQGKATSVRQYMPYFTSATTSRTSAQGTFISLQINACGFLDESDGSISPALFLWYNAPSSQLELTAQLKRDYMALAHIPSMVTVLANDGRVLHQNGCSVAYMGFVMGTSTTGTSLSDPVHKMRRMFVKEPEALQHMLSVLSNNKTWHGLVRMPVQLDLTEDPNGHRTSLSASANVPESNRLSIDTTAAGLRAAALATMSRKKLAAAGSTVFTGQTVPEDDLLTSPDEGEFGVLPNSNGRLNNGRRDRSSLDLPVAPRDSLDMARIPLNRHSIDGVQPRLTEPNAAPINRLSMQSTASYNGLPMFDGPRNISFTGSKETVRSVDVSTLLPNSRALQMLSGASSTGGMTSRLGGKPCKSGSNSPASPRDSPRAFDVPEPEAECWHEVQASKFLDPVTGEDVIMLIQTDVTSRVATEKQLRDVLDAEHKLLEEIFPRQVLEAMTADVVNTCANNIVDSSKTPRNHSGGGVRSVLHQSSDAMANLASHHEQVSILFADIVGFTEMCKCVAPDVVMEFLNDLYTRFDELLEEHGVYKVETIGDCYMVAGGLVFTDAQGYKTVLQSGVDPLHAHRLFTYAQGMLLVANQVLMPHTLETVKLRIGIHSGPVVSGVVGKRMPRFCLFGDTVNTASRMESTSLSGAIHVSKNTRDLIGQDCWVPSGGVHVKGKGTMETYYWSGGNHGHGSGVVSPCPTVTSSATMLSQGGIITTAGMQRESPGTADSTVVLSGTVPGAAENILVVSDTADPGPDGKMVPSERKLARIDSAISMSVPTCGALFCGSADVATSEAKQPTPPTVAAQIAAPLSAPALASATAQSPTGHTSKAVQPQNRSFTHCSADGVVVLDPGAVQKLIGQLSHTVVKSTALQPTQHRARRHSALAVYPKGASGHSKAHNALIWQNQVDSWVGFGSPANPLHAKHTSAATATAGSAAQQSQGAAAGKLATVTGGKSSNALGRGSVPLHFKGSWWSEKESKQEAAGFDRKAGTTRASISHAPAASSPTVCSGSNSQSMVFESLLYKTTSSSPALSGSCVVHVTAEAAE